MPFGLPNVEQTISNFLEGKRGITLQRSVDFDAKYLWLVEFTDSLASPPAPFDQFFPVNDITIPMAIAEAGTIDLPNTTMKYPSRQQSKDMNMSFYDDTRKTLMRYFKDWIELDIHNDGQGISGLKDNHPCVRPDSFNNIRNVSPVREMRVAFLDAWKDEMHTMTYWIFPEGNLDFNGANTSDAQMYTMSFSIVAEKTGTATKLSLLSVQNALETIGRFF